MLTLKTKYNKYLELLPQIQDEFGFVESQECDSLLFTSLLGCIPEVKINIDAAFDAKTGMWQRRPTNCPCYPEHSASTISRDQLLGLAWYAYYNKRLDISESVIKYALKNKLVMGEGELSRTLMTPSLLSTYCYISYRLGGPNRWWLRWIPDIESKHTEGYQAHLTVLHILLRNELTGKQKNTKILQYHADRQPLNPLFLIAINDKDTARDVLMQQEWFPNDRLPSSSDRKAQWLPMRDEGSDWDSCREGKVHSGGDFLFCWWLLSK